MKHPHGQHVKSGMSVNIPYVGSLRNSLHSTRVVIFAAGLTVGILLTLNTCAQNMPNKNMMNVQNGG